MTRPHMRFFCTRPTPFLFLWLCTPNTADAKISPQTVDAKAIAEAAANRDTGDKQVARISMTLIDAKERKRVRVVSSRMLKFDGGTKTVMFFESPLDIKNTGLLSVDYDDASKSDDQWLYLPSLHRSTRISTSDKSGAFMGTDISYADLTQREPSEYTHRLVKAEVKVDGEICWLIEAKPKTKRERKETGYQKVLNWISKDKLIPIQSKMWVPKGRRLKYMKSKKLRLIDGIWVAQELSVTVVHKGKKVSSTVMRFESIRFNDPSVTPADFTEQRLEQGL